MHARNFEKPVHWHRKYRSTRKRQLCRGDKGRRGWYGKRSLEEEKKERKKRKKREKEKRKSQRADRWPAGTKLKGYDATGWAGTTLRGKKGAGMRIGIEGTPVVLAKVIFRLDGLVYFAILWGKISLSCLRRRPLSLSSWLRDHYFGTWLPWTFIRQTFAVVSHPATFLLFSPFFFFFFFYFIFKQPGYIITRTLLRPGEFTEHLRISHYQRLFASCSLLDTWMCSSKQETVFE